MQEMKTEDKVRYVIDNISKGRDLDVIAIELGYKNYKSLDMFMRREGYYKDKNVGNYYPKNGKGYIPQERFDENACISIKALEVIQYFKEKKHTPKQIAVKAGFQDVKDMALYMKSRGFIWDVERNNYVMAKELDCDEEENRENEGSGEDIQPEDKSYVNQDIDKIKENVDTGISKYLSLLEYLYEKKERLARLLEEENSINTGIPRYIIQGIYITKSVHMSSQLDKMVKDYSMEKSIPQKDIFEIALVEFFMKYGYDKKMRMLLGNE